MKKEKSALPDKPSELLRLAIRDLELVEKDRRYEVDMNGWHDPNYGKNVCSVCLAGSVMAKSLRCPSDEDFYPEKYIYNDNEKNNLVGKLHALNNFRTGEIELALLELGIETDIFGEDDDYLMPVDYEENPKLFKQQMLDLADILEVEGF